MPPQTTGNSLFLPAKSYLGLKKFYAFFLNIPSEHEAFDEDSTRTRPQTTWPGASVTLTTRWCFHRKLELFFGVMAGQNIILGKLGHFFFL
jgi:hypothetical protein